MGRNAVLRLAKWSGKVEAVVEMKSKPATPASSLVDPQILKAVVDSLPAVPEKQLECGLEIMKSAFAQRVAELEAENGHVRSEGKKKMKAAQVLEQKVSQVESNLEQLTQRAKLLGKENQVMMEERDKLQEQAIKFAAHVKALQAFKSNVEAFLECTDDLPDIPETPARTPKPSSRGNSRKSGRSSRRMSIDCSNKDKEELVTDHSEWFKGAKQPGAKRQPKGGKDGKDQKWFEGNRRTGSQNSLDEEIRAEEESLRQLDDALEGEDGEEDQEELVQDHTEWFKGKKVR